MRSAANLCIVGLQWGDEGKGKIVDYLADPYEAVVRFNGGSNAGHTVVIGKERHTFHLTPSGALKGKRLFIGSGVAVDPLILGHEIELFKKRGVRLDLVVDGRCTVVTPFEKAMDGKLEELRGEGALGTTKMGIGPAYAMRALRLTPRAMDLFSGAFDLRPEVAFHRLVGGGSAGLTQWVSSAKRVLKHRLDDVASKVTDLNEKGSWAIFEGSQGALLDLLHGTYPFVTSSPTTASYVSPSVGIARGRMGEAMGVVKCYTTRVGAGPFPTEIGEKIGPKIREIGKEYGATTGRPRRIGWLDLVALKYTIRLNGVEQIALSKIDVLMRAGELKVCTAYNHDGTEVTDFYDALTVLDQVEPVYEKMDSLRGEVNGGRLPRTVESFIDFLEDTLRVHVSLVSYGEERSKTVER